MPDSEDVVRAAERAVADTYGTLGVDNYAGVIRTVIRAVTPLIAGTERERIAAAITPRQLRKLADWFDDDDEFKTTMFPETWPERAHEVQDDLRAWATLLEGLIEEDDDDTPA